jgi:TolB-like protein/DNA-binding winged helix-turn-helix (wHTH) protein/Tfp pilus assembly protein PilF
MKSRIYRFAEFELDFAEALLRTTQATVRLQEKPLLLLGALLDQPQRLVTREQLRQRMWDSRTVVDYEQGINVAIKKVRDALGDSVNNPRFIETVAKKGYRFLVPVEVVTPAQLAGSGVATPAEVAAPTDVAASAYVVAPALVAGPAPVIASADVVASALAKPPFAPLQPPTLESPEDPRRQTVRWRWLLPAIGAGALCAGALALFEIQIKPRHSAQIHSIAVLPLQDLSPQGGQEYFADGITEEVITDLAQTLPLRVISRTSVLRYKQTREPIAQIARELGVEAIVEGSIARSGDRVSVTVQLIDAAEDRHLWAQKYERNLVDIMAVEAELSQAIATQVNGALSSGRVKLSNIRPVDPQVHELCLMGRYYWNKRTAEDLARSEQYFKQALARDPDYAPAYAGLADVYALQPSYDTVGVLDTYGKAVVAAHRALELDDRLAEPHATLGIVSLNDLADGIQTESEFRWALELNPNYASAHHWFAYYLFFLGRRNEALAEIGLARQLDPLSAIINADEGHFLYAVRRYEEATRRLRRAIELAPDLGQPHETLAMLELETGNAAEATSEARRGLAFDPRNPRTLGEAGYVLASTGQTADATALLTTLQGLVRRGTASAAFVALVEIGLGRRDEALDVLKGVAESSPAAGTFTLDSMSQWHAFDEMKTDPRYLKLFTQQR